METWLQKAAIRRCWTASKARYRQALPALLPSSLPLRIVFLVRRVVSPFAPILSGFKSLASSSLPGSLGLLNGDLQVSEDQPGPHLETLQLSDVVLLHHLRGP